MIDHILSNNEQMACAHVADWLERKCEDRDECVDERLLVAGHAFGVIDELSNEKLSIPSSSSYLFICYVLILRSKNVNSANLLYCTIYQVIRCDLSRL